MLEWTANGRFFYGSIVYNMARQLRKTRRNAKARRGTRRGTRKGGMKTLVGGQSIDILDNRTKVTVRAGKDTHTGEVSNSKLLYEVLFNGTYEWVNAKDVEKLD